MDKWFFQMKTVPQQGLGCALACVATIAGVTFDTAKKAAFPRDWRERVGFSPKTLQLDEDRVRAAFHRLGWMTRPVQDFRRLITPSVIFLDYYGAIHAMVWDPFAKEFRDPGNGWSHRDEIIKGWRKAGYRSVTVMGRRPGAGPAPEVAATDTGPSRGVSVDPVTGDDDADLADEMQEDDGLCGCGACWESRARAARPADPPACSQLLWRYDPRQGRYRYVYQDGGYGW